MKVAKPYKLFISSKCSCCSDVLAFVKSKNLSISITNVDEEEYNLPFSIMMFPALVLGDKLMSYGCDDIISRLKAS
jgi:hypothetical protein